MIDSQMDDMIKEKLALKQQIDSLEQNLSNQIKEKESLLQTFTFFKNESNEKESKYMDKKIDLEKKIKELDNIVYKVGQSAQTVHMLTKPQVFYDDTHKQALGYQNPFYLKKAQRIKPTLYDGSVISSQHAVIPVIDDEETLILEEVSRSKMLAKQNDPISKEKKINTTPINYVELNRLSEDFGKRFVPQQELSAEQAFWLQTSHPNTDQSATSPVKIEAPRELPKVSLVNTSLKKLKYHLGKFDTVVKKRITPDAITEGEWGFEHTKKCSVDKKLFEIEKKELKLENERLLEHIICQDVMNIVMHADGKSDNVLPMQNTFLDDNIALDVLKMENDRQLKKHIQELKGKSVVDSLEPVNKPKVISLVVLKLDLEPLSLKLKNNKEAHVDYIRFTKENADTLRDIVEQARASNPLDNAKRISEKRTKNQAKTDKTEHGMEKRSQSQQKSKSKSTPTQSTVNAEAIIEEMGPSEPI
ncbi:hypothetical protein Tco_0854963 [Tanacetum coccineum]